MTYCVALRLAEGLVLLSDTRTNAGVDSVSVFCKLQTIETPGDRLLAVMSAGNLAITQAVWSRLCEGVVLEGARYTLSDVPGLFRAAQLVGEAVRAVYAADGPALQAQGIGFDCSLLLAGQIRGERPRLFLIYAAGNFIEATEDTPFLQIGETKYGKPILDRVLTADTSLTDGIKLAMVSMDSTLRSNLTVGMPCDLLVHRRDTFDGGLRRRIDEGDPYFALVRDHWGRALRDAYMALPPPDWA